MDGWGKRQRSSYPFIDGHYQPCETSHVTWPLADNPAVGYNITGQGLGIMIIEGKHAEVGQGIFISDIQEGSAAEQAGLIVGDMILAVNKDTLLGSNYDAAAALLKKTEGVVSLVVCNPNKAKAEEKAADGAPARSPTPQPPKEPEKPRLTGKSVVHAISPSTSGKLAEEPPADPATAPVNPGRESTIEINKDKMGLGLSIVGGSDTLLGVIIIHEVYPDGAAAKDGRLKPGDQILEVNSEDFRSITHSKALAALRQTPAKEGPPSGGELGWGVGPAPSCICLSAVWIVSCSHSFVYTAATLPSKRKILIKQINVAIDVSRKLAFCFEVIRAVAEAIRDCDLPANCRDQWCTETKDLVASLRITIEVLEAEIRCLRGKKMGKCGCDRGQPPEWTVVNHSRKHLPVKTENRYQALAGSQQSKPEEGKTTRRRKPRTPLPFSSILIEGDSHTRDLADLVRRKITRVTKVKGVCKSGAKLLEAVADDSPAPGSCCVIIAGTNDVASGQQYNIYKHLEQRITRKLRTASVVVSTLPHRHDLPATHLIHQETALINNYIEELCERHHGAVVMDFNRIGRGAFTQHGMHLRSGSKHLLAELVVDSLRRMNPSVLRAPSSQPPAASAAETPSTGPQKTASAPPLSTHPATLTAAAQPHVLPFDSFAEAVKSGLPNSSPVKSPQKTVHPQ
ncbi:hypothetical protein J6590_095896, partial [Homalodisca vitripennis]